MRAIVSSRSAAFYLVCLTSACAPKTDIDFQRAILSSAESKSTIDFTHLVAGDWDRMCVVRPYTTPEIAKDATGTSWRGFKRSGIEMRDDVNLLVFIEGEAVIRSALVGRLADFHVKGVTCVSADSARWTAQRRPIDGPDAFTLSLALE